MPRCLASILLLLATAACGGAERTESPVPVSAARNLLLITIDTLRADRIGAYGDRTARTPAIDALAARGTRFANAFAVTPITLPSHASIMSGLYPAGHGARHNGLRVAQDTPTIAGALARAGFATGGFVSAFPLDRRFGLNDGFAVYSDRMPRGTDGRPANERAGRVAVDEAIAWLKERAGDRFFLWVHLFEPHAPYGDPRAGGSVSTRYAAEITEADHQVGRLIDALGTRGSETIVALVADHGEAFGEHGEIAHSIFIYDTTLRVPMMIAGPGVPVSSIDAPVSQVDLAPTLLRLLGVHPFDADGVDLTPIMQGAAAGDRVLYAESFAPLLDFGWSPLRSVRSAGWKYIAAPNPELYQVSQDRDESRNLLDDGRARASEMQAQVDRFASDQLSTQQSPDPESAARLQALGYASGSRQTGGRPDPKDRRELAARIAQVTSGELHGEALERQLRAILSADPGNPLAHLRLGYVLFESNRCREATTHFRAAVAAKYPSADPHLGLAGCFAAGGDRAAAARTLRDADRLEPGNPVVLANLGLMLSDGGDPAAAIDPLQRALAIDPDLHQARFALALALADSGRRAEAAVQASELLRRLPPTAPQRPEVQRLHDALK